MERNNEWLNRAECSAMRGIAIMAIMLHNYSHWLSVAVKENEYLFHETNNQGLRQILTHPDTLLPMQLVSYFGHYGVPVFLFLSGFGLVMKYERPTQLGETEMTAVEFLRHHFVKLFTMMIAGFAVFAVIDAITHGAHQYQWHDIVAQMFMYINVLPQPNRIIWPGPYWFFGLMMQLYIVYRLVIYRRHWGVMAVLVALCWLIQALCYTEPESDTLNRLRYNCIGGMMPFCAGVMLARLHPAANVITDMKRWQWAMATVALAALLTVCSFNYHTWLFTPLIAVGGTVAVVKALPKAALTPLVWTGGISVTVFVIHPVFRKIFIPISHHGNIYDGLLLYIMVTLTISWMVKRVTKSR